MEISECVTCARHRLIPERDGWTAICHQDVHVRRIVRYGSGPLPLAVSPDQHCPRRADSPTSILVRMARRSY